MVGKVVPELNGRINGVAVRLSVSDVSMIDLTCRLRDNVSCTDICTMTRAHATNKLAGIPAYCDEPVASTDMRGNPHSSIFDSLAGMQAEGGVTMLVARYGNEWGHAPGYLDLTAHISRVR